MEIFLFVLAVLFISAFITFLSVLIYGNFKEISFHKIKLPKINFNLTNTKLHISNWFNKLLPRKKGGEVIRVQEEKINSILKGLDYKSNMKWAILLLPIAITIPLVLFWYLKKRK